jgi:hypothetical protein
VETAKKIQPKEAIDVRTRWQGVTDYRKAQTLLAHSVDPLQDDAWCELDPTSRSDLDPFSIQCRIVTDRYKHSNVNQRARGSGIQGQLENGTAARSPQFRPYDNQAPRRIKNEIHNTIAVS